jgi:hypothetical protein
MAEGPWLSGLLTFNEFGFDIERTVVSAMALDLGFRDNADALCEFKNKNGATGRLFL